MWIDRWSGLASAMAIQVLLLQFITTSNYYRKSFSSYILYEVGILERIRLGFSIKALTLSVWEGQGCGGLTYTFAVYSEHLKEVLKLSQERTDDIGAAKDFGYSFGIVGGLLYNFYPPFVTVSIGALLHFVGYMSVSIT